ncbi:MAG: ParA family protein [bacterium]
MAKVVSFINYKGGVGKTTVAVEMAASLAYHKKKRVLLADLDPQTNATFYLMTAEDWENWARDHGTLKNIIMAFIANPPEYFKTHDYIYKDFLYHPRNHELISLHLLPSHLELMTADMKLAMRFGAESFEGRKILRTAFETIKNDYDYIICDCPPNLNITTQNAILASDALMIVAMPEYLSTLGISEVERAVRQVVDEINQYIQGFCTFKGPEMKGIIFNRVHYRTGGTNYQESMMDRVREQWPDLVFDHFVSQSDKLSQSSEPSRYPIAISGYAADRVYENQLKACAEEFMLRLGEN